MLHILIPVSGFHGDTTSCCQLHFFRQLAVLGIGERVGITPLGGLVACLYAADPEYVKGKYNLPMLREIENLVAEAVEVNVPFMNPITFVPVYFSPSIPCLPCNAAATARSRTRPAFMPRLFLTIPAHTKF